MEKWEALRAKFDMRKKSKQRKKRLRNLPGVWDQEVALENELNIYFHRIKICKHLTKSYNDCHEKKVQRLKSFFSNLSLEKSMSKNLVKIDESLLDHQEKAIISNSRFAFKTIDQQTNMGLLPLDDYDTLEVSNNVSRLNGICKNIKQTNKMIDSMKSSGVDGAYDVDLQFQMRLKENFVTDFINCAKGLLKILKLKNRMPIVQDAMAAINSKYENFLSLAQREMSSCKNAQSSAQTSTSQAYNQILSKYKPYQSQSTINSESSAINAPQVPPPIKSSYSTESHSINPNFELVVGKNAESEQKPSSMPSQSKLSSLENQSVSSDLFRTDHCIALCDFNGASEGYASMHAGERLAIVKRMHGTFYTKCKRTGKVLPIRSELVELFPE